MDRVHFPVNLRLLCTFMPSISDAGRRLGINRSQLNKYLAGSSRPRPALLRRIGDFFGVEVHELLLPPDDFATLLNTRRVETSSGAGLLGRAIENVMRKSDQRVHDLAGTYFEYYYSLSCPGKILRTLMIFENRDGALCYRRLERVVEPGRGPARHFRYDGIAVMLADRVFLADYEYRSGIEITQSILYPDYGDVTREMTGIKIGVAANRLRAPCAVRVYLQRVPAGTSILSNLRKCGVYAPDSDDTPAQIRAAIDNRRSGPSHFASACEA